MLYRLFTEDVKRNSKKLLDTVSSYYEGFTVLKSKGYWRGKQEASLVVEVVTDKQEDTKIKQLASAIRDLNRQECVLVQRVVNKNYFI